jgi:hypothetical protein
VIRDRHRTARHGFAQPPADQGADELADPGREDHRQQHDDGTLRAGLQLAEQHRREEHRRHGPADESAEGEDADHESLPEPGNGVSQHDQ